MLPGEDDIRLAIDYHRSNRLDQAEKIYQNILAQDREHPEALYGLGAICQAKKDYQAAERWLLNALRIQPNSTQSWFSLGNLYQTQEKFLEAAEAYWQAMSLRPDSAAIFNNLGYTLQRLEHWDEAVLCYQKALDLQPNSMETEVNLGNVLHILEKLSEEQLVHLKNLNYQLGMNQYQSGNFKIAQLYLLQAVNLQPDWSDAYAYLGLSLVYQNELEAANEYCQKALQLDYTHELACDCLHEIEDRHSIQLGAEIKNIADEKVEKEKLNRLEITSAFNENIDIKSDTEILGQISVAIWNWAKSGFSVVDQSIYSKRYNTCMQCPHLVDAPRKLLYKIITANNANEKACALCGCVVSKKTRIVSESCPDKHPENPELNRWGEPFI